MPGVRGNKAGDLLAEVVVRTPRDLTPRQQHLLQELDEIDRQQAAAEDQGTVKPAEGEAGLIDGWAWMERTGHHDSPLSVGRQHRLLVGVRGHRRALPGQTVVVDVAVRAEDMDLAPHWLQQITATPERDPESLAFFVTPRKRGRQRIEVEFYYQRHWLTRLTLDVEVV
jgi:hypothetical protein